MNHLKSKQNIWVVLAIAGLLLGGAMLHAQPEEIVINHKIDCVKNQRAPVRFPHELHMENFDCLDCHHKYENGENVLDPDTLEEGSAAARCASCHPLGSPCNLMEAFHDECLGCHDKYRKAGEKTGPRMCNDCHPRKKGGRPAPLLSHSGQKQ